MWDFFDGQGLTGFKTEEEAWADLFISHELDRQSRGLPCTWDM